MSFKPLLLLLSLTLSLAHAAENVEAMTARLKQMYPATRIERVDPSEIPALYEVVMGQNVAYTDASGRYFVFGHLFDMQTQRDLTAERLEKQQRVAFSELPFADAIKTVRGNR
jgi:thiol:disulfide interchange protein DsbC